MDATWGTIMILAAMLALVVLVLVAFALIESRRNARTIDQFAELATTLKDSMEHQTKLVDKLVTLVVAKDPLAYQAIRAGDSLVRYDDSSSGTAEEIENGGDDGFDEDLSGSYHDDSFVSGAIHRRD